jgi:hypothetical protein
VLLGLAACADDQAPRIVSSALVQDSVDDGGPYRIVAVIVDDRTVESASATLTATSAAFFGLSTSTVAMIRHEADTWIADVPGLALGTTVRWFVSATDDSGHVTLESPPHTFHVGNVPSLPEILTLWPNSGPSSGGTEVLIVGRDLRAELVADFDRGFRGTTLSVLARTQSLVTTPVHPEGLADVIVTNLDGGTFTLVDGFTYFPAPEIDRVEPPSGPASGGTRVTIFGRHFPQGAWFLFDGNRATDVVITSETIAHATTPPGRPGFVTVRVEHPEKGWGEKERAYEYIPPPIVEEVIPPRGPDLGGTEVQVIGKFFQNGARLFFDNLEAGRVRFIDSEQLVAVTPPHAAGFSDVTVRNPDDQSGTLEDGYFFFGPPIIDEVVPPYASADGGAVVEIHGENFEPGSMVEVEINGVFELVPCTFVSMTVLSCTLPASAPGFAGVRVTNSDGRSDQLDDALAFFDIFEVIPDRGPSSGGTAVLVRGVFLPRNTLIQFGAEEAICMWSSETEMRCTTPPGPPDSFVDVFATPRDPGQAPAILEDGYFYVAPPNITSIDPARGPLHGGTVITIRGDHFHPGITITIGGVPCTTLVFVSDTELTCTVPPGNAGVAPVVGTNPDGQSDTFIGFEYVPVTFTPIWGLVDGFATMTVRGVEFTATARVWIGSQRLENLVFISDEELVGDVPSAANTGNFEVKVEISGKPDDVSPDRYSYRTFENNSNSSMHGQGESSEVMIHDMDNDGDSDLIFLTGSTAGAGDPEVMENQNLTFTAHPLGFTDVPNEGNACDYDEDGYIDLVWGSSGGAVQVTHNDGNMTFTQDSLPGSPPPSFEASFHEVTGDGRCDIINLAISDPDHVLRNTGGGNFSIVSNAMPHENGFVHDHKLDTGDFDGDGDNDMVVTVDDVNFFGDMMRNRIYLNDGSGVFTEDTVNRPLMESIHGDIYDVRAGDLDLDGDIDIITPNYHRLPNVLINDGTGVFTRDDTRISNDDSGDSAMVLFDVEGDGDLDVYFLNLDGPFGGGTNRLFLNDHSGFFHRASRGEPQQTPATYRGAMGDIDGDGATDILLGVASGPNQMYFAVE